MTRQDFLDNVNDFDDLVSFCYDIGHDFGENIYNAYAMSERVDEDLRYWIDDGVGWEDIRSRLNDIPAGYEYYYYEDTGEWAGIDEEFEDFKDEVYTWAIDNGGFEDDDDSDEEEDEPTEARSYYRYEDDPHAEPVEAEEITAGELFTACVGDLESFAKIDSETKKNDTAAEEADPFELLF